MKKKTLSENKIRIILFVFVGLLHAVLLFFVVFNIDKAPEEAETPANLIRLVDIEVEIPPPPPEPPPEVFTNTYESIAENMIETDEEPPDAVYENIVIPVPVQEEVIEYIPQGRITEVPEFPDDRIRRAIVHPAIARNSGVEGRVILELFIDRQGNIRDIAILLEDPENRGFGEAAVNAFNGIKADRPAYANGEAVAARYRYSLRFTLR